MPKVTVRAGSNIAFIKYWGVANATLNLPLNSSISMTLADAHTTTTVAWNETGSQSADSITLDGLTLPPAAASRIIRHLDRIRSLAGLPYRATVVSCNNFPMASGIASSASGFAALTVAACRALGLDLDPTRLSALARLGSGSASRSLFGGFVLWERGVDDATSVARQLVPAAHWDLHDVVAVVSQAPKQVSSEGGHRLAASSPLNPTRVTAAQAMLNPVRDAIRTRDLAALGPLLEQDALAMHAVMFTSSPSLVYWLPGTLEVIQAVRRWRADDGLAAYFTIDAGPNVHILCAAADVKTVETRLAALSLVEDILSSGPGPAPVTLAEHLF